DVIRKKTASLIATCCESAAVSVDRTDVSEDMRKFGELVGLAFQIKDDIFDYGAPGKIGKPTGLDIRERKMTLPLIYALNNSSKEVRKELINIVKNHNEDTKKIRRAVQLVIDHGGIKYAHKRMTELAGEALEILKPMDDSQAKRSLIGLVEYTINREK
ncbi:MAG: polyprenyl synthetase family protein, partial [Bacteroidota bacterium]